MFFLVLFVFLLGLDRCVDTILSIFTTTADNFRQFRKVFNEIFLLVGLDRIVDPNL